MKKLYLILLMLLILFIPTSINAVAIYQLDQPIKELDNYTLRQVFTNRNRTKTDLNGKSEILEGVYRLYEANGLIIDYNINNGQYILNGTVISTIIYKFTQNLDLNISSNNPYYMKMFVVSGSVSDSIRPIIAIGESGGDDNSINGTVNERIMTNYSINDALHIFPGLGVTYNNYIFTLQLESGSVATPYQLPTSGPYNQFDFGYLDLTQQQIQIYYDLYLEAVRFEQENEQASQDIGGYQNIFRSIINGVKNLISEMGYVWQWLNAPILTSDFQDYQFNIDWSWDLIGVIRQIINSAGVLVMQVLFFVPSAMFILTGIPINVSILSLLFSNLMFLLLGWIMVKSFLI